MISPALIWLLHDGWLLRLASAYVGKPVLMEEFGVTGLGTYHLRGRSTVIELSLDNKTSIYPVWVGYAIATGHA